MASFDGEEYAQWEQEVKRYFLFTGIFYPAIVHLMTLAEYRKSLGLTLDQLAAEWQVPRTTLHNWESGERTPRLSMARKIKELTKGKVTPDDFGEVAA